MVLANMLPLAKFIPVLLLCACTTVTYTASCPSGDDQCQRNQNAKTLESIGYKEAATRLMCKDPDVSDAMRDKCPSG